MQKLILTIIVATILGGCTETPPKIQQGTNDGKGNIINIPELSDCKIYKIKLNNDARNSGIYELYITRCGKNSNVSTEYNMRNGKTNKLVVSNTINFESN